MQKSDIYKIEVTQEMFDKAEDYAKKLVVRNKGAKTHDGGGVKKDI